MKREIEFTPAFDRRHSDPNKNYGIHGVEMRWVVSDERGAVQFLVYTNWHLPHVMREQSAKARHEGADWIRTMFAPLAADIGYHSPVAQYDDQEPIEQSCKYLGGRPCFYDGSSLQAEPILETLIEYGGDAVWALLESRHADLFGPAVDSAPVRVGSDET